MGVLTFEQGSVKKRQLYCYHIVNNQHPILNYFYEKVLFIPEDRKNNKPAG